MLWPLSRAAGRHHRDGRERVPVRRRLWDGPARAKAMRLERSWPGWVVLYGPASRRFFAMAAWPVPEPVMVWAPTAEGLEERMEAAETALLLRLPASGLAGGPALGPVAEAPEWTRRHSRSPGTRRTPAPARGLPYSSDGLPHQPLRPPFPRQPPSLRRGKAA